MFSPVFSAQVAQGGEGPKGRGCRGVEGPESPLKASPSWDRVWGSLRTSTTPQVGSPGPPQTPVPIAGPKGSGTHGGWRAGVAGRRELCCRACVSEGRTWLTGCRERGARGFYGAPSPRQEGRRAVTLGDSHPVTPAPECRRRGGVGWRRSLTSVASSHPRPRPREGRGAAPPAPSRALRASLRSRCAPTPRLNTPAASSGDLSSPDPLCRLFRGTTQPGE